MQLELLPGKDLGRRLKITGRLPDRRGERVLPLVAGQPRLTSYTAANIGTNVISLAWGAKLMEVPMATFVVLASFSDQGIKNVKQTIERADAFKQMATKAGATIKDIYWTLGAHDVVAICEAPDDETATALSLSVASRGNVCSETLRAFSFDEMKKVLGKMV